MRREALIFSVHGPFRTSGAGVAQRWVGTEEGSADVGMSQQRMKEAFSLDQREAQVLRQWLLDGKALAAEAVFYLFGLRARQTDLDNLLRELFNQMLLALFPDLPDHQRSRKDHVFYEVRLRKVEVFSREEERSIIKMRPLA